MKGNKNKTKNEIQLIIPENMEEVYITGGAIASTPIDIRLILFNDELLKDKDILENKINLVKKAKTAIIMNPKVAKQIRDLIDTELKKI